MLCTFSRSETTIRHRPLSLLACLLASLATCSVAATDDGSDWKTGEDFRNQLQATIGFQWQSIPIRAALHSLANNQRIAIWLDRRVDPDYQLDLTINDTTLDEALRRVATAVGGGVSYVEPVAYIGSPAVTSRLATLAALRREDIKRSPTAARARFEASAAWSWQALTTPRELLDQLAREANVTVVNADQIPHDLWPARELPPLPWTDRMTLLLAGFDLTFEVSRDGSAIRLAPLPEQVVVERTYAPRGSLGATEAAIVKAFPDLAIRKSGARLVVTGTVEQHHAVDRFLRGETVRSATPTPGSKRFDLRVENQPIGAIIQAIAQREQLQVRIDPAIQSQLQQLVSLDVKQLTLDELLDRTLGPAGVAHRIEDGVLVLVDD